MATVFLREGRRLVLRLLGVLGTRAVIAVFLFASVSVGASAWRNLWTTSRAVGVDGTVIRQIEHMSADWDGPGSGPSAGVHMAQATRTYQAVVGFKARGTAFEVVSSRKSAVQLYPTGSSVRVSYPDGHPDRSWIQSEGPDAWSQAALLLMGTVVAAGAAQWWWWLAKRRPRFRRRAHAARATAIPTPAEAAAPREDAAASPQG